MKLHLLPLGLVLLLTSCVIRVGSSGLQFGPSGDTLEVDGVELPEEHVETLDVAAWHEDGLEITAHVGDIEVVRGERNTIRLTLHEVSPQDAYAVLEGGKVVVRTTSGQPAAIGDVRVVVAEDLAHLRVDTGLGDVSIERIGVRGELHANSGLGDVEVSAEGRASQVVVTSGLGDLEVKGAACDWMKASTGMGDVQVSAVEASSGELRSGMGDVRVKASTFERLRATTGMGDVDCRNVTYEEADLDSGMGSVRRK